MFLKMFSFSLRTVPTFLNKFTYKCFYSLLFHLLKMRRKVVLENLKRAFPHKNQDWYHNISSKCYKFFIKDFLEFLSFPRYFNHDEIKFKNIEILDDALKHNNGVLFVGGHFGAFDKLFYSLANRGYSLCGVAYKQKDSVADMFFKTIRERYMKKQLYKGGSSKELKGALNNNEILVLLSDQDARDKGKKVNFFDIPSSTPSGAAILHKRMGSPIVFFTITKINNEYFVEFKKINASNALSVDQIVQEYTSALEAAIRQRPEQYFWFHKRWKTTFQ